MRWALRATLLINALATMAAGVVLFVSPDLIAETAGLRLPASANFIYGLLGASEFGLSVLCWLALRLDDPSALRAVSAAMAMFHGASGVAELIALGQGLSEAVVWNIALRAVMVTLFLYFGVYGTSEGFRTKR